MSKLIPALLAIALAAQGCKRGSDAPGETDAEASGFTVEPDVGGQGTSLTVHIGASSSVFEFGATDLALGEGIVVESVTVQDGYNAVADVVIAEDAALGARDVTVSIEGNDSVLPGAFSVIAESFVINPNNGKMGETVEVDIAGRNTAWEAGYTWAGFGEDVDVLEFTVLSETAATARIAIHPDATPGPRDVMMENGPHVVTLYDGFQVDRAVITAFFEPASAYQGDEVEFTITGLDTNFDSTAAIEFWDDGGKNGDIEVTEVHWLDAENMYGKMRLSNAARIGLRDVLVDSGGEQILIPDAFEVLDAPPDLSDVVPVVAFYVAREVDNSSGELLESVVGYALFYIPLDPPCGAGGSPPSYPDPYDQNGVYESPEPPPEVDCPNPETVEAGDYVWFESDVNTVTLERTYDASINWVYYWGYDLTLDDYQFDQWYDVHIQGVADGETGLPETLVEDVQPTVPADYYLLTPDFWGDLTVSRTEDFEYTWTPAQTYPDAIFLTQISGSLVSSGKSGYAASFPWDDGVHTYTASELSQLNTGPVSFLALSYISGVYWGLPYSIYQNAGPTSSVLQTSAQMNLE